MTEYRENCCFFRGEKDQRLYGCTYLPEVALKAPQRSCGVVVVSAVGRERLRCYHESANLARELAAHGYPVIRFDYRGEGESSGSFAESTVTTRLEDIATAATELRRRAGVEEICLLGFRLGSLLAVLAAGDLGIQRMILCDPVCNPRQYAKGMLRSNILLQSQYFGKVSKKEAALREELLRGGTVSVYGFNLGQPFLEQLERTDPAPHLTRFAGKAALLYMSARQAPPRRDLSRWRDALSTGGQCETICTVLAFSWASRKVWMPRLRPLNEDVLGWLQSNV